MGLRKGNAYSKRYARPYTRKSKVKQKSYIKAVPNTQVVKLRHGDLVGWREGKYPIVLSLVPKTALQVRDNSIEAVRQYLNRFLMERVSKDFYLEILIYPHHVLRENRMLSGAGADRLQTGMARSFGSAIGRAALVRAGEKILIVGVKNEKEEAGARKLLHSMKARLPGSFSIQTEKKRPAKIVAVSAVSPKIETELTA
jgi:large subunit ribosomal protein L10e